MTGIRGHGPAVLVLTGLVAVALLAPPGIRAQDKKGGEKGGDKGGSGPTTEGTGPHIVTLTGGNRKAGEIQSERASGVVLKMGNKQETIAREQIVRIEYTNRPAGLTNGDRMLSSGNAAGAAEAYMTVGSGPAGLFKPHGLYHAGRAYLRARQFDKAGQAFSDCAKADPQGWFLKDATREAVRAYIRAGDTAKASALAEGAQALFTAAGVNTDEATLVRAEAFEAAGKRREAVQAYVSLAASRDPGLQARAELGRGRGDIADGSFSAAEARFRKLLEKPETERVVRAGAARGVGDCLFKQPDAKSNPAKLRAAAAAYSEALSVHFPGPDDPTTDREATLASAAECYEALAALPAGSRPADAAKNASDRFLALARTLREELAQLYPSAAAPAGRN